MIRVARDCKLRPPPPSPCVYDTLAKRSQTLVYQPVLSSPCPNSVDSYGKLTKMITQHALKVSVLKVKKKKKKKTKKYSFPLKKKSKKNPALMFKSQEYFICPL